MATFAELISMDLSKLLKELETSRKSLFDIKYKVGNKQEKASHQIKVLKKTIAQILTALQKKATTEAGESVNESKDTLEKPVKKVQDGPARLPKGVGTRSRSSTKPKSTDKK